MDAATASQFGFIPRWGPGKGDNNGVIQGFGSSPCGFCPASGEAAVVWVDLSTAHMIDGGFNTAVEDDGPASQVTGSNIGLYFPSAKIGGGNYIYVWSGGQYLNGGTGVVGDSLNYFGISAVSSLLYYEVSSTPGLTVRQAYDIDKK